MVGQERHLRNEGIMSPQMNRCHLRTPDYGQHPSRKLNLWGKWTAGRERNACTEGYWARGEKQHCCRGLCTNKPSFLSSTPPGTLLLLHLHLSYSRGSVTCRGEGH